MRKLYVLTALAVLGCLTSFAQNISTVAGSASSGFSGDGGPSTAAQLNSPYGVAADASGNIYISDTFNHRIRKVTSSTGNISTIAGNGSFGYSGNGGDATAAMLSYPLGIAVDTAGNVYFVDYSNYVIRKIAASTGIITTVAGNHTYGYTGDGGAATAAKLGRIWSLALDGAGNIYISDLNYGIIRKVTVSTGIITTVAGTGTHGYSGDGGAATAAKLGSPEGVAVDTSGNIYISDNSYSVIRKVTASTGDISTIAGNGTRGYSGDGGAATAAELSSPYGLYTDASGNVFVSDEANFRIREINASTGIITTVAGSGSSGYSGDGGAATAAQLYYPMDVALDGLGNLYIADRSNNVIRMVCEVSVTYPVNTTSLSNRSVCSGSSATLTVSGSGKLGWYSASSGGIYLGSGSSFTTPALSADTTYYVQDSSSCGATGRTAISVTVNPLPVINVSGNTTICDGDNTTLTASGASTYSWNTGGTDAALSVSPSSNTSYTVTGTDANSCSATQNVSVTVNPLPVINVSGNTTICDGDNTTLTASGASTYSWSTGSTDAALSVSPSANTSYTVTGTDANSCSATQNVSVTVNPLPVINVSGNTTICDGDNTTLTASGANTYSWNTGGTDAALSVSPSSNTSYTVTGTDANSCSATQNVSVTVNPLPVINVSGNTTICNGDNTTLTASGASTYSWNTGNTDAALSVSPSSNTSYTVTGTDANSCSATQNVSVTVNPLPVINVSGNTTICDGDNTTLTASGASTYSWNTGGTDAALSVSPSSNTSYTVTGTDANSCSATQNVSVTVNPLPVINVSGNTTICDGDNTTLTASGANTYSWNTGGTDAALSVSPSSNTSYTVTGTDANSCSATQNVSVTVNPLPVINVSGNTTICDGDNTTLTASGASTYSWNTGGTDAALSVSPSSNASYTVTGTDANSCSATQNVSVTVNPLPVINVSGNTTICAGDNTTLTASGASTYSWNTGGTDAALSVSPSSNASYTVTGTDANSCSATQNVSVTVNPLPVINVSGNTTICDGDNTTLTASGASTYSWNTGGTDAALSVSPTSNTSYTVTGTDANSCSATQNVSVTVNPLPVINVSGNTTICDGDNTTLTASGASSYSWNTGGTDAALSVSPSSNASYTVTGTDANSCSASQSVSVTVNALPVVSMTESASAVCAGVNDTLTESASGNGPFVYNWSNGSSNSNAIVNTGGSYSVTVTDANGCHNTDNGSVVVNPLPVITISGMDTILSGMTDNLRASGAVNYVWSDGSSSDTAMVSPSSDASYSVTGTDANGCSNSASFTVIVNIMTSSPVLAPASTSALVYPNPATENIYLSFNMNGSADAVIKIMDITGKELMSVNREISHNAPVSMDISTLAQGVYFAEVITGSKAQVVRFIKQ